MSTKNTWRKIRCWCGRFALLLLVASIISGFGWDITTSDLISRLTCGFLNRMLAADLHRIVMVPLVFLLFCHIAPNLRRQ